jgi:phosphatidylserine/phosphatidylglycerophosphate/cardiolipin synthase-like enzyme
MIAGEKTDIVLTRPRAPSRLDQAISDDTSLLVSIEDTADAFASLAAAAEERLTIMTPFLDEVGANWAISLFEIAGDSISKELILRFLNDPNSDLYPDGLPAILPDLRRLGVKVFDYGVPRPDIPQFYETFHAKVICADGSRAYVGSANLSRHSKETSMELGTLVSGRAALCVNSILEKIRSIAISI